MQKGTGEEMNKKILINRIPKRVSMTAVCATALLLSGIAHLAAGENQADYETALLQKDAKAAGQAAVQLMDEKVSADVVAADEVMEYAEELMQAAVDTQDEAVVKWVAAGMLRGAGAAYFRPVNLGAGVVAEGTDYSPVVDEVCSEVGRLMGQRSLAAASVSADADASDVVDGAKKPFRLSLGTPQFIKDLFVDVNTTTYRVSNRLSVRYDDNIYSRKDKKSGMEYRDTLTLSAKVAGERSTLTFRYSPSYVYRPQRDEDTSQLFHNLGALLTHAVSPRLLLRLDETFRYTEQPERKNAQGGVSDEQTYYMNKVEFSADTVARDNFRFTTRVGNTIKRYKEDAVAEDSDYTLYHAGLDVTKEIKPGKTIGMLFFDASTQDYNESDDERGHNAFRGTLGISQTFNPSLSAEVVGGATVIDNDSDINKGTVTAPYGRFTLNYSLSPRTLFTAATGYSFNEDSDEGSYGSSLRTDYMLGLRHEMTAKLSMSLTASYMEDEYSSDLFVIRPGALVPVEGTTEYTQYQARLFYRINRKHMLDAGYRFTDLSSDVVGRDDWDRHQVDVGWRVDF
jgi:hypothetical protein